MKFNYFLIKRIVLKLLVFITIFTISFIPFNLNILTKVNAYSLTKLSDISFDINIAKDERNYSNPSEIIVVPIDISNQLSSKDNVKGIIYYTIDRLGLGNTIFHYFIDYEGNVYQGNNFGEENTLPIVNSSSSVVIGYLNNTSSSTFDPRSTTSIQELLTDISNRNSINPNNISVKDLTFKRSINNKTLEITSSKSLGGWENAINNIKSIVNSKYSPKSKSYTAEILEVNIPTEEVNPGEELIVSIKLKNTGVNGNYKGYDSELYLSRVGGANSAFYINKVWESQSQTSIMDDLQNFLPNDETVFDFKVKAPLYVGNYSETFEFKTLNGSVVKSDTVDIKLNIRRGDKQIVEIKNNGAGFVNVFKNPFTSSEVLIRAASGERFFLKSENLDTLWAEIDIGGGVSGWLAIWNITYL